MSQIGGRGAYSVGSLSQKVSWKWGNGSTTDIGRMAQNLPVADPVAGRRGEGGSSSSGSSGRVRGGRETWNLCSRLWQPSFLWLIFTGPGGIMAPLPPPPRIRYISLPTEFCTSSIFKNIPSRTNPKDHLMELILDKQKSSKNEPSNSLTVVLKF